MISMVEIVQKDDDAGRSIKNAAVDCHKSAYVPVQTERSSLSTA